MLLVSVGPPKCLARPFRSRLGGDDVSKFWRAGLCQGLTSGPSPHECPFPKLLSSSLNIIYVQTTAECSSSTLQPAYLMSNFSVLIHQCFVCSCQVDFEHYPL